MNAGFVAGALGGAGLWAIISGFWPVRPPLTVILGRVGRSRPEPVSTANLDARIGSWAVHQVPLFEQALDNLRTDIRVLGREPQVQAAKMLTLAVVGVCWGPFVVGGLALAGLRVPWIVPVWLALVGGVAGAVVPYRQVRAEAARRRADFAHALGACCDVLSVCLASGQTTKHAIDQAVAAGDGWAFGELRVALHGAYLAGDSPWGALATLGVEMGIDELSELGAALSLAGEEGAAVRGVVRAKARVLRERLAAGIERDGAQATEGMTLPTLLLAAGFFVFWSYPAFATLLAT